MAEQENQFDPERVANYVEHMKDGNMRMYLELMMFDLVSMCKFGRMEHKDFMQMAVDFWRNVEVELPPIAFDA